MATALDAAIWMVEELNSKGRLFQAHADRTIAQEFGEQFVYVNENGNLAIGEPVLSHFRTMTKGEAVWAAEGFYWRKKTTDDPYGERKVNL